MPSFDIDVSEYALNYARSSMQGKAGNAGQETLISDAEIDGYCIITVNIAGEEVDTSCEGNIIISSNHPEAIEIIIKEAEQAFEEFVNKCNGGSSSPYSGLDIIQTVRQMAIDDAFGEL